MSDLKKCQKALKAKGYDPVFISLYGSQNYNCDTKDSDHDYKAIVMPTLDDFILTESQFLLLLIMKMDFAMLKIFG